jgi:hypothetical protein
MTPCNPFPMADQLPTFEIVLRTRGRKWRWSVCNTEGVAIMQGSESSRPAARYEANRALFLILLAAPYRSRVSSRRGETVRTRL